MHEREDTNTLDQARSFKQKKDDQMFLPDKGAEDDIPTYGKFLNCAGYCCGFLRTWMPCLCVCGCVDYPYKVVEQGNEGLFTTFGRFKETVQPGLHYVNPCTDKLNIIDVRINVMELQRQNVITKDNIRINIDCSVYFRVINSRFAHFRVRDYAAGVTEITYAIVKNTCGQFILQDLLEKRAEIANDIEKQVDSYTQHWGIDVIDIFFKDIQLDRELQNSMSSAAKERRMAESKMIIAKAEVECAKLMRSAAECLNSPAAIQMRYLQTLKQMGSELGKLVFVPKAGMKQRVEHMITQGLIL